MSIRRLKTLIAIAECGTFTAAAGIVLVSKAAVSQQMKNLEEELGTVLFDRSKRSPQLNPLGQALVPKARDIVRAYEDLAPSLTGMPTVVGELTIGALPTTMSGLIPQAMGLLRAAYPSLHIRIVPGLSADLYPQVDRGFLDAAITSEPNHVYGHMQWRAFAEEPLIVVASIEARQDDPRDLLESYPYIRFSRRAWVGQLIDEWLRGANLKIHESMELDTLESISYMVFNNLGVSIVPQPCISSYHPVPLKRVPIGEPAKPRRLGVLTRRDTGKFWLVDIFHAELVQVVEVAGEVKDLGETARSG